MVRENARLSAFLQGHAVGRTSDLTEVGDIRELNPYPNIPGSKRCRSSWFDGFVKAQAERDGVTEDDELHDQPPSRAARRREARLQRKSGGV